MALGHVAILFNSTISPLFKRCEYNYHIPFTGNVAEWLRRWTANPIASARVGSNPILVDDFLNEEMYIDLGYSF